MTSQEVDLLFRYIAKPDNSTAMMMVEDLAPMEDQVKELQVDKRNLD